MYIQLKDFNSYMSAENKDWLYIFVQSFICVKTAKMVQQSPRWCSGTDPQPPGVLSLRGVLLTLHGVIRRMIKPSYTYVYSLVVKYLL